MVKKKIIIISLIVAGLTLPIFGQSLDDLLIKAQEKSDSVALLEISKQQTMLSLELKDVDPKVSYTVSPGASVAIDTDVSGYSMNIGNNSNSNLVDIVIPGKYNTQKFDDSTKIGINGNIGVVHQSAGTGYSLSPSISASHNFLFGEYNSIEEDLKNQSLLIEANQSYEKGLIDFQKNIVSYVENLIANEKSMKDNEKKISDLKKKIDNQLSLKNYDKNSVAYKKDASDLTVLENYSVQLKEQSDSIKLGFKDLTGVEYEDVTSIRMPNFDLENSNEDSLTVQKAKINLQIAQNTIDEVERDKARSSLNLSGGIGAGYQTYSIGALTGLNPNDKSASLSPNVSLNYKADNFSLNGGVSLPMTYDSGFDTKPQLSIGGSWSNDVSSASEEIVNKQNEKTLIAYQMNLNSITQNEKFKRIEYKNKIDAWNFTYNQLEATKKLASENLELTKQMFDLGLSAQSDVDEATFTLSQLKYDELSTLIDGIKLELDLKTIQL